MLAVGAVVFTTIALVEATGDGRTLSGSTSSSPQKKPPTMAPQ